MRTDPPASSPTARALRRARGDEGQTIVEAAIVLPAMVFLILCVLQLTMIQHARIMTDYAAYCAARAGIVFNGDPDAMQRAAVIALSPLMGRTDTFGAFSSTVQGAAGSNNTYPSENGLAQSFSLPGVLAITVLPPVGAGDFASAASQTGGQEIDFDDIQPNAALWNVLQLRLQFFYRMRIPFANQILQAIYFASVGSPGLLTASDWQGFDMTHSSDSGFYGAARGSYAGTEGGSTGVPTIHAVPQAAQISLASQGTPGVYYFPLSATYSMRMQSNWYAKNAPQ